MTEETIFAEALEKSTPIERTAYLDTACVGDSVLRQRIETLLESHEAAGGFLDKPAIQCAAEELSTRSPLNSRSMAPRLARIGPSPAGSENADSTASTDTMPVSPSSSAPKRADGMRCVAIPAPQPSAAPKRSPVSAQ